VNDEWSDYISGHHRSASGAHYSSLSVMREMVVQSSSRKAGTCFNLGTMSSQVSVDLTIRTSLLRLPELADASKNIQLDPSCIGIRG